MADPANDIFFSSASAYEIFQKVRLGRLAVPRRILNDLASVVLEEGWMQLPLTVSEAARAASIEHAHRDPFDRMLAAQCHLGSLTLVSRDGFFEDLPIHRIW